VARLAGLPYEEQLRRAEEEESFQAWGVCDLLLRKSREATSADPHELQSAEETLRVAEDLLRQSLTGNVRVEAEVLSFKASLRMPSDGSTRR